MWSFLIAFKTDLCLWCGELRCLVLVLSNVPPHTIAKRQSLLSSREAKVVIRKIITVVSTFKLLCASVGNKCSECHYLSILSGCDGKEMHEIWPQIMNYGILVFWGPALRLKYAFPDDSYLKWILLWLVSLARMLQVPLTTGFHLANSKEGMHVLCCLSYCILWHNKI